MEYAELVNKRIKEAFDLRLVGKFDECLNIIEAEVNKLEAEKGPGGFCDDEKNVYYSCDEVFERALIRHFSKSDREIVFTDVLYSYMFYTYALVLYDLERFDEAKVALKKAMRWNPVDINFILEYSMIFKSADDHERALEEAKKALEFAYTPEMLARCYYNISTFFIDTGLYQEAIECLTLARHYNREYQSVYDALEYVEGKIGKKVQLSLDNIKSIAKEYGFSCSVNREIFVIALDNAAMFAKLGIFDAAKYYIEIASYWSKNKTVNELWDCITEGLNKDRPDAILSLKKEIETWAEDKEFQKPSNTDEDVLMNSYQAYRFFAAKQNIDEILKTTREEVSKKNFKKALSLIEPLVNDIEKWLYKSKLYDNTPDVAYFDFRETFESVLYEKLFNPVQKNCEEPEYPLRDLYMAYGGVLMDLKRFDEAAVALRKGMRWDPINADLALEYAATFQFRKKYYEFFEITKDVFKIAFRKETIARCYRNLGFCFSEREMWSEAVCCYKMSMSYVKDSEMALSELDYIAHQTDGKELPNTEFDDFVALAEKYGFPVFGDANVIRLAYNNGKHFFEEKQWNAAQYYLGIANEIRDDDEIKRMLDTIAKKKPLVN